MYPMLLIQHKSIGNFKIRTQFVFFFIFCAFMETFLSDISRFIVFVPHILNHHRRRLNQRDLETLQLQLRNIC